MELTCYPRPGGAISTEGTVAGVNVINYDFYSL